MLDDFKKSATEEEFSPEENREIAEHGILIGLATIGVAICLIATLKDRRNHADEICDSVSETLREEAMKIASEDPGDNIDPKEHNRIMDHTPERSWPIFLCEAIYKRHGLDRKANHPACEKPLIYAGEDFPPAFRAEQRDLFYSLEDELRSFIETGAEHLRQYLNYPHPINPVWCFMLIEEAQGRKIKISSDIKLWFDECFDAVLVQVHQARLESGDNPLQYHHNA